MFNRNDSSNKNTFWPNKIEILQWMRLKYRSASTQLTYAKWLEIAWTIIPVLILILIAIPSLKFLYYSEDPLINKSELPTISLTVIDHQWYWSYEFIGISTNNNSILSNDFMNYDSHLLNIEDIASLEVGTDKPLFNTTNLSIESNDNGERITSEVISNQLTMNVENILNTNNDVDEDKEDEEDDSEQKEEASSLYPIVRVLVVIGIAVLVYISIEMVWGGEHRFQAETRKAMLDWGSGRPRPPNTPSI